MELNFVKDKYIKENKDLENNSIEQCLNIRKGKLTEYIKKSRVMNSSQKFTDKDLENLCQLSKNLAELTNSGEIIILIDKIYFFLNKFNNPINKKDIDKIK